MQVLILQYGIVKMQSACIVQFFFYIQGVKNMHVTVKILEQNEFMHLLLNTCEICIIL